MALFKRQDLKAKGFTDDQIEYIMTESGRSLASNYTLKSDVQAQIDAAVAAAKGEIGKGKFKWTLLFWIVT